MEGTSEQKYHKKCVVLVLLQIIKKLQLIISAKNDGELYMKLSY